ncbi:MAG TPA: hypothetical protein VKG43_08850, partial [Acidimicrobiales bacterium]|nr:hypothetical protein [Acidimicrobiales bacterium]
MSVRTRESLVPSGAPMNDRLGPDVIRVAIVVVLGSVMSVLDSTIVNIALATLAHDLHTSLDGIQWVITSYLLALGAVIP